ncbi:MAG: hypothetical protein JNG43_06710 [Prevotellamassilia sp.]|nr:hypothetical protein [Prevotellamassilia sp.]
MKKTITLLGMLLAFFATAGAQQYCSTTATPYSELVSGKSYAVLVAADKNCGKTTDYSNATFLSGSGTQTAFADAKSLGNDLRGKAVSDSYSWIVTVNDDNTISLQVKGGNYLPAPPNNGQNGGQLSATAGKFTRVESPTDDKTWCMLSAGKVNERTIYLNLGGSTASDQSNKLEFWPYATTKNFATEEVAKFKFFELIEGDVAITYNYTINGTQVGTYSFTAVSGMAYPTPGNLPDFVTATAPEGTVTEATTKNVEVNISNYPFKFSLKESDTPEWGYLTGNISTADRKLFTNGTTSIVRSAANAAYQNSALNGIADDLWRMVGNPFDGFKIMNKSGKCFVKAASGNGATYTDASATKSDNLWKVYGGDIIGEPGNITDTNKEELKAKAFVLRHSTVGEGNNYLNPGGASDTSIGVYVKKSNGACFLFLEPEFTVNLNTNDNLVASFATLALPFDFKVVSSTTNDAKLYSGAYNATTGTLDMTAVEGVVPANAGVVIKSDSKAENIVLTANAKSAATALTGNQLVGTTEEIAFSNLTDKLVFGVTAQNHVGFYAAGGSAALPANRAYLPTSVLGGEKAVAMNFGGNVTGINAVVKADKANAAIYDLTGRRVTRTVKGGLYIQNGSKFVAR